MLDAAWQSVAAGRTIEVREVSHVDAGRGSSARDPRGRPVRRSAGRPPPVLRVRPLLPAAQGRGRGVQGALQQERAAARPLGLRRRRAVRPDREKAVLSRPSWRAGLQLRHARMRSALRLLPELGHVAGASRSGSRLAAALGYSRRPCARRARPEGTRPGEHIQRAAHHERMGRGRVQGSQGRRPDHRLRVQRQRHRPRCSSISARGSISTRSI